MRFRAIVQFLLPALVLGLRARPAAAQAADTATVAPPMPFIVGAYAQGSIILAHTYAIRHLVASHPTGFELNAQRQTTGAAPWHAWYKFPKIGVALTYYDFHNPVLGQAFSISPYLSKTFWTGARGTTSTFG